MRPLLFAMPGNEAFAAKLLGRPGFEAGTLTYRRFPDGESYVRINDDVKGRDAVIVCTLARPDEQFLGLWYAAQTLRELGARRIALGAPYLCYMRQDKRFQSGEAVTSKLFASLVCEAFDYLITADPHLHRFQALSELYRIGTHTVATAPALAVWIRENVDRPIIIGPDEESEQWAASVAAAADAPHVVLRKIRHGDRDVSIDFLDSTVLRGRTPVLIDDIISSGKTMLAVARHLRAAGYEPPVCIGVHGLFDEEAAKDLMESGVSRIVTTNTVPHASNAIDVSISFVAPLLQRFAL
ncbi:MAG TPA: ribose-phosphate pyrophosphokinase [Burkholderiales bacterium]|nr:ribose-phosphate pyrophosphokinase [Burkholderiales bacterium]